MGTNRRNAYLAVTGLLCIYIAGCTSSRAIASQGESSNQRNGQTPMAACPSQDFTEFLHRYADVADDEVRRRFTDDPLEYEVPTYTVEEETESSPITHISRHTGSSRLDLFPFRYFKDAGVFDQIIPGEKELTRQSEVGVPMSIETITRDERRVDFGMEYEMDTYLFKRSRGCWHLTRVVNLRD